ADQVCPRRYRSLGPLDALEDGARAPPEAVPGHGVALTASEGEGDAGRVGRAGGVIEGVAGPDRAGPHPPPATQVDEGGAVRDAPDQADSLLRPLRRRAFSTARPARSAMRWRKPWRRARRRLLG